MEKTIIILQGGITKSRYECEVTGDTILQDIAVDFLDYEKKLNKISFKISTTNFVIKCMQNGNVLLNTPQLLDPAKTINDCNLQSNSLLKIYPNNYFNHLMDVDKSATWPSSKDVHLVIMPVYNGGVLYERFLSVKIKENLKIADLLELVEANFPEVINNMFAPKFLLRENGKILDEDVYVCQCLDFNYPEYKVLLGSIDDIIEWTAIGKYLAKIPDSMLQHGLAGAKQYCQRIIQEESVVGNLAINECKVVFAGPGGVGKTSLVKQLMGGEFDLHEPITHSVSIAQWWTNWKNDEKLRINLWDFGGQEILNSVHKFFMTEQAIYVLTINCRDGNSSGVEELRHWLKLISNYAPLSPIIVVVNKADIFLDDIGRENLKALHPQIHGFAETSCSTGKGIGYLEQLIVEAADTLPFIHKLIPLSYKLIKENLEEKNFDYIRYEQYEKICKAIKHDMQFAEASNFISLLNSLGTVLNITGGKIEHSTYLLNPKWLIKGVNTIIHSDELRIHGQGFLEEKTLLGLLKNKDFEDKAAQQFILQIMIDYEVCFQLDHGSERQYLFPLFLPKDSPSKLKDQIGHHDGTFFMVFDYDFLPITILPKLMKRLHSAIADDYFWRRGFLIETDDTLQALFNADIYQNRLVITILGNGEKAKLLRNLVEIVGEVNAEFSNINFEAKIPIDDSGTLVPYTSLDFARKGKRDFWHDDKRFSPREVLFSIDKGEAFALQNVVSKVDQSQKYSSSRNSDTKDELFPLLKANSHLREETINTMDYTNEGTKREMSEEERKELAKNVVEGIEPDIKEEDEN